MSLINIIVAGIKYTMSKGDVKSYKVAQQTLFILSGNVWVICSYILQIHSRA